MKTEVKLFYMHVCNSESSIPKGLQLPKFTRYAVYQLILQLHLMVEI